MYERRRWRRRKKTEASQHVFPLLSCPHAKFPRRAGVFFVFIIIISFKPVAARRGVLNHGFIDRTCKVEAKWQRAHRPASTFPCCG